MTDMHPWQVASARRDRQVALRRAYRLVSLGSGPEPHGWQPGPDRWLRCALCGYLLQFDGRTYDSCFCGALGCDPGYARVGSVLGDAAIERVRLDPF